MSLDYNTLEKTPRLLLEAELKPLQGDRFQPTGFADLGPAKYKAPKKDENGDHKPVDMLLVDTAQSIGNWLEKMIWDEANSNLVSDLDGLSYIRVNNPDGTLLTTSLQEAHRINSEYIIKASKGDELFKKILTKEFKVNKKKPVERTAFWNTLFKYDINSIVHGCFLEEIDGRLRAMRILSGFIEAAHVSPAESGGVKINHVEPGLKGGEGNVPYPRTEFVAKEIKAYFHVDTAQIQALPFDDGQKRLLLILSLLKLRRFLSSNLRLRSGCMFKIEGSLKCDPSSFTFPEKDDELLSDARSMIEQCKSSMEGVTEVIYSKESPPIVVLLPENQPAPDIPDDYKQSISYKKPTKTKPHSLEVSSELKDPEHIIKALQISNEQTKEAIDRELKAVRVEFDDEDRKPKKPKKEFKDEITIDNLTKDKPGRINIYNPGIPPEQIAEMLFPDDSDLQQKIIEAF